MKEVAPRVFVEWNYALVTIGAILTDEGWICIDTPPYPRDAWAWRAELERISDLPIRYIVNTDQHRDRILGDMWFEAPVVVQEAAARHMLDLKSNFVSQAAEELSNNDNQLVEIASVQLTPPQVSYDDSLTLYCGEREVVLYHRPGACYGNSWLALPDEKLLFAGDSVVANQHPPITEGRTSAWLQTLSELQSDAYKGWTIVPGRGKPISSDEVKPLADYLSTLRRRVASLSKSGRPRSELGGVVGELLGAFPHPPGQRDEIQRRIRAGLETVYEEIRSGDAVEETD